MSEKENTQSTQVPSTHPIKVVFKEGSEQEKVFYFRKPRRDEVNVHLTKARTKAVDSSVNMALSCVQPDQREELNALMQDQFGFGVTATGEVLKSVGFTQD